MKKQFMEHIAPAIQELEAAGIPWEIEIDRRHKRIVFSVNGKRMFVTVSGSPSDKRSSLNLRADVRNSIRMGAA